MIGPISKFAGYLRLATIQRVDPDLMIAYITFRESRSSFDEYPAQLPISYLSAGGGFIGGLPGEGTPVVVGQAEGAGHYFIVAFLSRDPAAGSAISNAAIDIPSLEKDKITIHSNSNVEINLYQDSIVIGEPINSLTFDFNRKILFNTFDYSYYIGQGTREINGVIKRDRRPVRDYPSSLKSNDPAYDDTLKTIGMDPIADTRTINIGAVVRNPARIEKREVVYEYEEVAHIGSNDQELEYYRTGKAANNSTIINRRENRVDALSLSLVSPNYLIESIKGTVVDTFGNILDINRDIIPIGKEDNNLSVKNIKSTANETDTFKNVYEQIKRLERRSIAFHFEINSRKETKGSGPPDVSNKDDYSRARSRLFLDVDKEGQFKLNVPASSETGNIGLLTRYENWSTVYPNDKSKNPNDTVFNDLYKDILNEPFGYQIISLKDEHGITGPIDRFSDSANPSYIKHGTVYHDISKTASTFQSNNFYNPYPFAEGVQTTSLGSGRIPALSDIVSKEIIISGPKANAGGRSGSLNFDGSLEVNIGANTVDRQSLWLDTQGGALVNLGRDLKNNVSLAMNADGQVLLQIGGETVPAEKGRFQGSQTGWMAGVLDVRVYNTNNTNGHHELTILRIDNEGVTVTTPGRIVFYSAQDMLFRSGSKIEFDAEQLVMNTRNVIKDPGKGPVR